MESKHSNKVLEALHMQPLSEEEKASRHILGRLWGPIATTKEKTRNGRGYNAELWDKALKDEIFREKVANKSLFLELGHPVDREETDMKLVCACIPELPKVIDGDLFAYVDILDTKQGRLLKTLCDYGFVPGISSRGSGDIMANDDVDPETFFLETWDIVQLPAVKKARLTMCESLNNNKKTLVRALKESLDQMSEEDKAEAEASLESLGVDFTEDDPYPDIPWAPGEEPLIEDTQEIEAVLTPEDKQPTDDADNSATNSTEGSSATSEEDKNTDKQMLSEADDPEEETSESAEESDAEEKDEKDENDPEELDAVSLGDFLEIVQEYDPELTISFEPIEINDNVLEITELLFDDEAEEGKIKISFNYNLETSDNIEDVEVESKTDEEESSPEEEQSEAEDTSEEAIDDGEDEVVESLKEMVRQKDALEEEVLSLRKERTVSDAEVSALKEELEKYKTGFMRVSELASKSTKLEKQIKTLNEQLNTKDATIKDLQKQTKTRLVESAEASKRKFTELQERLLKSQNEAEATEQALREQVEAARKKTREVTSAAKAYKQKYVAVVEHYIASKATMLGVSTHDITSKLTEGYTLEDVDRICDKLLDAGRPAFNLGMGGQRAPQVKLNESAPRKQYEGGYDIDDDLLELAGLK